MFPELLGKISELTTSNYLHCLQLTAINQPV